MAEITLPIILQFLQTAGILVGIIYYITIMRNQQRTRELTLESQELARKAQEQSLKAQEQALETRQTQLFMYMYDRWSDPEFMKHYYEIMEWSWTDYDAFWERYGASKNPDTYLHFSTIGKFFEGVGVLVKRELVDPSLVDDLMSGHILRFWEKFGETVIKERQVRENSPQYYEYVEYLYSVIKPIVESQHPELKT